MNIGQQNEISKLIKSMGVTEFHNKISTDNEGPSDRQFDMNALIRQMGVTLSEETTRLSNEEDLITSLIKQMGVTN